MIKTKGEYHFGTLPLQFKNKYETEMKTLQVKHYVPFTQIENSLIQNTELTIYDKMIYIVLCSHANMNNSCFPSYKTIAKESCCSERQAKLVIKNLEKKGYVIITRRKGDNGKNQSNVYEMMMPLGECNAQG